MNDSGRKTALRANILRVRGTVRVTQILKRMTAKGKKILILQEVRETTTVRSSRPTFRKVYCLECGRETGMFERDGETGGNAHVILCPEHSGDESDDERAV